LKIVFKEKLSVRVLRGLNYILEYKVTADTTDSGKQLSFALFCFVLFEIFEIYFLI